MKQISSKGRAWLRGVHILFASLWVGAAVCMILLNLIRGHILTGDELWAVNKSIRLIDEFIVIPGAMGCLITGILFSWLTPWGFFKFNWITVKYIINVGVILLGTFFLGPWVNGMEAISQVERLSALQNGTYLYYAKMSTYLGFLSASLLIAAVFITVLKPWGRRTKIRE